MKKQRLARVKVERGFGPRHAFNAQEGSEAVPSGLPEPPPEELKVRRNSLGNLRPALLAKSLGEELGGLSKEDVAKLAVSMLVGGEAEPLGGRGAVPMKEWNSWKTVKPGDATSGEIRVDHAGNHYEEAGSHLDTKAGYENPSTGGYHAIVKPVEAPGGAKGDPQFPSLDKPPYDALKYPEGTPMSEKGTPLPPEKPPSGKEFYPGSKADLDKIKAEMEAEGVPENYPKPQDFEVQPDMTLKEKPLEEPPPKFGTPEYWKKIHDQYTGTMLPQDMEKLPEINTPPTTKPPAPGTHDDLQNYLNEKYPGAKSWDDVFKQIEENAKQPPPEEEPPFEPNVPRYRKGAKKVGVAKGFGPRHAENAKEGDTVQAVQGNTDTVPAMLTPREAVLNRNAAELAGRGNIEQLNSEGNQLAQKGVDLAAEGDTDVKGLSSVDAKEMQATLDWIEEHAKGSGINPGTWIARLMQGAGYPTDVPKYEKQVVYPQGEAKGVASVPNVKVPTPRISASGNVMKYVLPGVERREAAVGLPKLAKGDTNVKMKSKPKQTKGGSQPQGQVPQYGRLPAPPQSGGFYPPGQGFAEGTPQVPGGIGTPNPSTAYDPRAQVDFKAPDISGFIRALHDEAKKQGISSSQMGDIVKQFSGMGGGGAAPGGGSAPYDMLGGQYASFSGGQPGYQGGISDIGYPPMLMPDAEYHADKGSSWVGPYDPAYLVQRYAGGTDDVGFYGNRRFAGGGPSTIGSGGRDFGFNPGAGGLGPRQGGGPGFPEANMTPDTDQFDTQTANYYRGLQGGFGGFGNMPADYRQPGFPQGPTLHSNNVFDAQGYPYAQPANSTDNPVPKFQWRPKQRS